MMDSERALPHLAAPHSRGLPGLRFHLPLDPARLLRARHRIRDYLHACAVEPDAIEDVVLAIQEAMTNAVTHSGAREDLEVDLGFEGTDLVAEVRDHGIGFDTATFDPNRRPGLDESSGRGLYLISHVMDEVTIATAEGLTVRAVKRAALPDGAAPAPPPVAHVHQDTRRLAVLEEIDEGFFALDWEYRYAEVNSALEALFDRPRDSLLGRTCWDAFPGICGHASGEALRDAMELGRPAILEYVSPTIGTWLELRVYPTASGVSAYVRVIEQRKRRELERDGLLKALRESREDLDRAQAVGQIGSWRLNLRGDILSWSAETCRIFGVRPGTPMTYERFLAIVHPVDRDRLRTAWEAAMQGEPYDIEHRIIVEGDVKWVREKAFLERDAEGGILGGFGIAQDITERAHTEEALRRSERRYRELVDNAGSAIIRWTRDGTITFFNEYAERLFGWRTDEVIGRHVGILVPPRDAGGADLSDLVDAIVRHPVRYRTNLNENVCRDGRRVWMTWTNSPIYDENGVVCEILAVGSDVTERRQVERALHESEERFRMALRNAPVSVAAQDRDLRFVWAYNQKTARPEEIIGKSDADLFTRAEAEQLTSIKRRVLEEGVEIRQDMWFDRPQGRVFLEVSFAPIRDEAGQVTGVGIATVDMTRMKLAEEALRESLAERTQLAEQQARQTQRLAVLAELAKTASSALDVEELGRRVAEQIETLLDASHVRLALPSPSTRELVALPTGRSLEQAQRHETPAEPETAQLARAFRSGEPAYLLLRDDARGGGLSRSWADAAGIASFAVLPLLITGRPIGVLGIGWPGERAFGAEETSLLESVAAEIAVGLENARLYEAQRRVAATLQENLVHPLPRVSGLDLAALSLPANRPELIGGDFHDVFETTQGHVVALIGDVMGKGVKAAGLTETVRSAVRALALVTTSPAEILTLANRLLLSTAAEQFVSALVMVLDPAIGRGRFASAGHPPLLIAAGKETRFVEPQYGPPLGTLKSPYEEREVELAPGEILVLYTDGVTEAYRDGELFGEERLLDAVRAAEGLDPQTLVERLRDTVIGFAGALRDDVDIVALRLTRQ